MSLTSFKVTGIIFCVSETPILDLEQAPPELKKRSRLSTLVGYAIPAAIGALLAIWTPDDLFTNFNFLLLLPAIYISIAVHELGHLLAGAITGMKPGALVVGGIVIMNSGDHWSVRFDFKRILGGGFMMPLTQKDRFSPSQFAWMVAGGPIASLALTILCGALSVLHGDYRGGWTNLLFCLGLLSMMNLIPMSAGTRKTDGARLLDLLRHPDRTEAWIALIAMQSEERRGVRPRDWDPELVERVLATAPEASEYPYSELLMYYREADLGDQEAALSHMENALAASGRGGKVFSYACYLEAAVASARMRKNAGQSRTWLERAYKLRKRIKGLGDAVDAAIAICEERYDDAHTHLRITREFWKRRKFDSGLARFALENLERNEALCKSALAAPVS